MSPEITVVIPAHNGSNFIGETLDSLAAQTLPLPEVIVVDDGSTDSTADIAESHPLRPIVVRQWNLGVAVARNVGLAAASSSHIAFLDQDDIWLAQRNERLLRFVEATPECGALVTSEASFYLAKDAEQLAATDVHLRIGSDYPSIDDPIALARRLSEDDGRLPNSVPLTTRDLLKGPPCVTTSYLFDRTLLMKAGGFPTLFKSCDDYLALLAVSRLTSMKRVQERSVLYRVHPTSTSSITPWARILATTALAVRNGDALLPARRSRDVAVVPDATEAPFILSRLSEMVVSPDKGDALDAFALARLLGSKSDRTSSYTILARRWLKSELQRIQRAEQFSRRKRGLDFSGFSLQDDRYGPTEHA